MMSDFSESIRDRMREFLHVCYGAKHNLLNDREIDSPDGGREVYFINRDDGFRYATVEMADDGNIYLLLSNRSDGSNPICDSYHYSADFFEIIIRRIQNFLRKGFDDDFGGAIEENEIEDAHAKSHG